MATATATPNTNTRSNIPLAALSPPAQSPQPIVSPSPATSPSSLTASPTAFPAPQTSTMPSHPASGSSSPSVPKQKRWQSVQISAATWIGVGAALGALIVAVYYGAPILRLANWAAWNDFRESCINDRDMGIWSAVCNRTLAEPARAPPVRRAVSSSIEMIAWPSLPQFIGTLVSLVTATTIAFVVLRRYWLDRSRPVISYVRCEVGVPVSSNSWTTQERPARTGQRFHHSLRSPEQISEDTAIEKSEDDSSSSAGSQEHFPTDLAADGSEDDSTYQQVLPIDKVTKQHLGWKPLPEILAARSPFAISEVMAAELSESSSDDVPARPPRRLRRSRTRPQVWLNELLHRRVDSQNLFYDGVEDRVVDAGRNRVMKGVRGPVEANYGRRNGVAP